MIEKLKFFYWYMRIAFLMIPVWRAIPLWFRRVRTIYIPLFKAQGLEKTQHHLVAELRMKGLKT